MAKELNYTQLVEKFNKGVVLSNEELHQLLIIARNIKYALIGQGSMTKLLCDNASDIERRIKDILESRNVLRLEETQILLGC